MDDIVLDTGCSMTMVKSYVVWRRFFFFEKVKQLLCNVHTYVAALLSTS